MGSKLVSGFDFPNDEGGEQNTSSAAPVSYTEIFYEHLPFYMSIGMTYDEFWNGPCDLKKYYRKAHEIKVKRDNFNAWIQGRYIYDAICAVSPILRFSMGKGKVEAHPYLQEPYPTSEREIRERQERTQREEYEKSISRFKEMAALDEIEKLVSEKENKEVTDDAWRKHN